VCAVEVDEYCQAVLCQRQNEGVLAPFPIWGDIRTFDGRPWRGTIDIISAGFPCTSISTANPKGRGLDDENKSGLWSEMRRIIGEVRPRFVLVENSPNIINKGGLRVVGDLAALGYDCRWGIVSAADVGAPHLRKRWWCLAYAEREQGDSERQAGECGRNAVGRREQTALQNDREADNIRADGLCTDVANADGVRQQQPQGRERDVGGRVGDGGKDVSDTGGDGLQGQKIAGRLQEEKPASEHGGTSMADTDVPASARQREHGGKIYAGTEAEGFDGGGKEWWAVEPNVGRVAHGVAFRVDRLRAIGNGQVPTVVKLFWDIITGGELE
jgi:DNA (cytosine-5)-methyltransferase 1